MRTIKLQQETIEEQPRRHYSDENPAITGKIPEGYMTGDEFVKKAMERITKYYKENGLL
jgi:hypothetical protein